MTALRSVTLAGFKGLDRTYRLHGPTVLVGPNGSGKSACMEGIVYAFTGKSPAGKLSGDVSIGTAKELVAQYFPLAGGHVQVEDVEGRWIRRGLDGKHKETIDTSDTKAEAKEPDLFAWQARPEVLDLREFLALSSERRREFMLRLCGGGKPPEDLLRMIEEEYCREAFGKGARPEVLGRLSDLGDELAPLATEWTRRLGVREVLDSHLRAPTRSLSETFLKLVEVAHEAVLQARRDGNAAAAARDDLAAGAEAARPAAARVPELLAAQDSARRRLEAAKTATALLVEARRQARWAEEQYAGAERRVAEFKAALERHPSPGPGPEAPDSATWEAGETERHRERGRVADALNKLQLWQAELRRSAQDLEAAAAKLKGLRYDLSSHAEVPAGVLLETIQQVPDSAHPLIPKLRQLIGKLSSGWQKRRTSLEEQIAETAAVPEGAGAAIEQELAHSKTEIALLLETLSVLDRGSAVLRAERAELTTAYNAQIAAWSARDRDHRAAEEGHRGWLIQLERLKEPLDRAHRQLKEVEASGDQGSLEAVELAAYQADEAVGEAQKAAGAVAAHEQALARAAAAAVEERAWKVVEAAIKILREHLVGDATAPLLEELGAFLRSAGRSERPYLETETDSSQPAFKLGWERDGARTALCALSTGEATLFCAGLALAIARRSPGRRLLLVEADPLDPANLSWLFEALGAHAAGLDALVVATAAEDGDFYAERAGGWTLIKLDGDHG